LNTISRRDAVLCLLILVTLLLTGCVASRRGATLMTVNVDDRQQEKQIRRQLSQLLKATEDVKIRYGLTDIEVEAIVVEMGGLGATTPAFSRAGKVNTAVVVINKRLFLDPEYRDDIDEILTGLMAHELAHALHYARMSRPDLVTLGYRYKKFMDNPNGKWRDWAEAYEQLTDLMAIYFGYGEELIHQKRASELNLAHNGPEQVWDFYLTEEEIRELVEDGEHFRQRFRETADRVGLRSFNPDTYDVVLDEDGDLIPPHLRGRIEGADRQAPSGLDVPQRDG